MLTGSEPALTRSGSGAEEIITAELVVLVYSQQLDGEIFVTPGSSRGTRSNVSCASSTFHRVPAVTRQEL